MCKIKTVRYSFSTNHFFFLIPGRNMISSIPSPAPLSGKKLTPLVVKLDRVLHLIFFDVFTHSGLIYGVETRTLLVGHTSRVPFLNGQCRDRCPFASLTSINIFIKTEPRVGAQTFVLCFVEFYVPWNCGLSTGEVLLFRDELRVCIVKSLQQQYGSFLK